MAVNFKKIGKQDSNMKQKSALKLAFNLFTTHVIGVILSVILSFGLIVIFDNILYKFAIGCFVLLIYVVLISGPAWRIGNEDKNKVKFNRQQKDIYRGFKLGLLASVPMFLLAILLLLAKAELFPNFYVLYKVLNAYAFAFIGIIDHTFENVQTAYLTVVSWGQVIAACAFTIIPTIVWGVNYLLGYHDIIVMDKLIYKKKDNSKNS